jgi:uncharacterized membrane protein YczE
MTPPVRRPSQLGPVAQLRAGRLGRRLPQLYAGLVLYGLTSAMMLRAAVGNAPWDVLHQGLAGHLPVTIGQAVILVSVLVLLLWIPLREMPGLGTVSNSLLVGFSVDVFLSLIVEPHAWWARTLLLLAGVLLNAVATAMYLGTRLGAGPRDGLMTGLNRRTGVSVRLVRTGLEVTVVVIGWLLGGVAGIGTVVYALAIGPLAQLFLPWFTVDLPVDPRGD